MIVHFTTVHHRGDTRIRLKEVVSLADGMEQPVILFEQGGRGSETEASTEVRVIDAGPPPRGRLARMTLDSWRMWRAVWAAEH